MKLAAFDFITHFGGAQRSTLEALHRLKNSGTDTLFIDAYNINADHAAWCENFDLPKYSLVENPRYPVIGAKSNKILRLIKFALAAPELMKVVKNLSKALDTHKPDFVLTYTPKALDILCRANNKSSHNCKFIYWCRGESIPQSIKTKNLDKKVYKYLCLSKTTRKHSIEAGFDGNKIYVVSNAIDIDQLNKKAATTLQSELELPEDSIKILVSATLLPTKGQACAIKAMGKLLANGVKAHLMLAGDCGNDGDQYLQLLKATAAEVGAIKHVHFLGWRNDIAQLLAKSDILLLPTHSEGMPRSVMEAMALKTAVVATPVGSIPEMLDEGRAGAIFPIDNDQILAEKLTQFIENPQLRNECIEKAFKICSSRYSADNQVRSFHEALK